VYEELTSSLSLRESMARALSKWIFADAFSPSRMMALSKSSIAPEILCRVPAL
jgi:hypothetical protein